MFALNFLFFLPNSMILSIFMLGIKIRAILNLELKGLHENVQNFYSRCLGSREIAKNEVETVLVDTLYIQLILPQPLVTVPTGHMRSKLSHPSLVYTFCGPVLYWTLAKGK